MGRMNEILEPRPLSRFETDPPTEMTKEFEGLEVVTYRASESSWHGEDGAERPVLFFPGLGMRPSDYKHVVRGLWNRGRDIILVYGKNVSHEHRTSDIHHSLSHEQERVAETALDALTSLSGGAPRSINILTDSAGGVHGLLTATINYNRARPNEHPLQIKGIAPFATAGFGRPVSREVLRNRGVVHMRNRIQSGFSLLPRAPLALAERASEFSRWLVRALFDPRHERRFGEFSQSEIVSLISELSKKGATKVHLFFPEKDDIFPADDVRKFIEEHKPLFDKLFRSGNVRVTYLDNVPHTALLQYPAATHAALDWFDEEKDEKAGN